MHKLLKIDFVRFCMVGALGFGINFVLLSLFYKVMGLPVFISQVLAAEVALFSNFMFHHHWTYKERNAQKRIRRLIVEFHVTSWVAIVGSAAIVSLCIHAFNMGYFFALVIASALALFWNFGWTKLVIWRHREEAAEHTDNSSTKEL